MEHPLMGEDSRSEDDEISLHSDDSLVGQDLTVAGEEFASEENRAVKRLRAWSKCALVASAVIVSVAVYSNTRHAQQSQFSQTFHDSAGKLMDAYQQKLQQRLQIMDALAVDMTSLAKTIGDSWPSVTLPDFGERTESTRALIGASAIWWTPIVTPETREQWENYAVQHQQWIHEEEIAVAEAVSTTSRIALEVTSSEIAPHIFDKNGDSTGTGPFAPIWQTHPVPADIPSWVNFDSLTLPGIQGGLRNILQNRLPVVGEVLDCQETDAAPRDTSTEPESALLYPIYSGRHDKSASKVVAVVTAVSSWSVYFQNVVPASAKGITVVVKNECNQTFSFAVNGPNVTYLGKGDHHSKIFDNMHQSVSFDTSNNGNGNSLPLDAHYCPYTVHIYPSNAMRSHFVTHRPLISAALVGLLFLVAAFIFVAYDVLVEQRQKVVMDHALQSTAIVSSLFPEQVRDRLFRRNSNDPVHEDLEQQVGHHSNSDDNSYVMFEPTKSRLKSFLDHDLDQHAGAQEEKPIADLFPNCTVLFADIAGFTAWSSLRDPAQVFTLLESVYQTFDKIARKRNVFKVETIGDSYVAVTGLPDPQEDHALIMCRFARDCCVKMKDVTQKLELSLGPDTGDLSMRFGLHSGPVTAGVLRGEKSRFQLFGDTVNTAARMESTGMRDRIQLSEATAQCLKDAGKGHWIKPRKEKVNAKGKGELQTYWFEPSNSRRSIGSVASEDSLTRSITGPSVIWGEEQEEHGVPDMMTQRNKHMRLIDYNVDLLAGLIKQVVARRRVIDLSGIEPNEEQPALKFSTDNPDHMVIEEVTEVISLPAFDSKAYRGYVDPDSLDLGATVMAQLKRYVTIIAAMYRNNPFHNFEHASHVTMSMNKLLQRVVAPDLRVRRRSLNMSGNANASMASDLHSYTYGITSDPLTQLAVVFAALIHDADHWGVSNGQLAKEGVSIAEKYKGKSVAEQHSVDLCWDLLMDKEEYGELQRVLFRDKKEYDRFRQIVVNVVMATDIFDKDLLKLRTNRWEKAFDPENADDPDQANRKATIVMEHIMQASDVAHTMQHWHVYQKWNRRLFDELYTAYRAGRMGADPTDFWVDGELRFFDGYIIPLAKKLKDCGVFGVASDECLNYALNNRAEWACKGHQIVNELVENYQQRDREDAERAKRAEEEAKASNGSNSNQSSKKRRQRFARRRSLFTSSG